MTEPRAALSAPVRLARAVREAGVSAGTDRVMTFVQALALLRAQDATGLYWAGRLSLCGGPEDIEKYDEVFASWARPRDPAPRGRSELDPVATGDDGTAPGDGESQVPHASEVEVVRHVDVADVTDAQRQELERLLAAFRLRGEERRTRRYEALRGNRIDRARTVRAAIRAGGEPAELIMRRRRRRPRKVVLLVDVSGSMGVYAEALIRFAHAAVLRPAGGTTEVFTVGTRLTRITGALTQRDPERAMRALADVVVDYKGGTRLGVLLKEFLDRWGQRGLARGAVVVILSDGWERGDPTLLGEQMARLGRVAHRVVWANPRKGQPGYAPLASGMAAALPFVDEFVEGHSLAALERLAHIVAGSVTRPTAPRRVIPVATPGGDSRKVSETRA